MSVADGRGKEPGDGTGEKGFIFLLCQPLSGVEIAEVPMPVPSDGLQGGAQSECQGGARKELSVPPAQVSLPRTVLLWWRSLRCCTPPEV